MKKKDAPSIFYKSSTDIKSFFNKEQKFVITKRYENYDGVDLYRIQELESGKTVKGRFLRKELFAL